MWMFGSRTTVKKVCNLLTWFSQNQASLLVTQREVVMTATAHSVTLLAAEEQYELIQTAYKTVGLDFEGKEELIGKYSP